VVPKIKNYQKTVLKPTPSKPGLFSVAYKQFSCLRGIAVVIFVSLVFAVTYLAIATPLTAQAATDSTLNFQARLETSAGAIAPDGTYNIEFKLYNVATAGSAEWTEDYLISASHGVNVANGYLTVNLGSITNFPTTINWDQQQYLTMNIGNSFSCSPFSSCSPDGEMNPRLPLTAVPYAFRAGTLVTGNGTYSSSLTLAQPASSTQSFVIADQGAAGTYNLLTGGSIAGATAGVVLQSSTPGTAQTGNFNISGTGTVGTLDATIANINTTNSQAELTVAGTTSDSTALGLVVNDVNGDDLLQVRNDGQVTIGKASGSSSTIGKTNIGATPDTGYGSLVAADKITTGPENATLNSISTYVGSPIDTTNNKYYLGIYKDNGGTPGTLIATSTQGTLTASAWNTLSVSASLSANTSYWLAFFTNTTQGSDPYQYYDTTATTTHAYDSGVSFSSGLPAAFTTSGTSTTMHSIYASVSETGPLGATLTVNPTNGVSVITPTNTTTALQVQNASGSSVFNVDTSNKVVSTLDLQVGSPANANASRIFSDGFESGNFNLWSVTNGAAAIDTGTVHSGKYAAKFSPAGSGQAYVQTHINGAATIDMRGYAYVTSQTTGNIALLTLCDSTCATEYELYRDNSTGKLSFYNNSSAISTVGSTALTTGSWHEIEADVTESASAGTINVYLDGTNVISLTGQNTGSDNTTVLNAGDVGYGNTAIFSIDDVAVDTARPGDGGNLTVGDSLHVAGTSTFGESLTIQATTDATPALTIYNSDGSAGLQILAGGSGGHNTFIGQNSGDNNVVNTGAGTGVWNTSLGNSALQSNTSGYFNVAVGGQALQNNTTGYDNSAFGLNALISNTSGNYNSGVGWEALNNNTTGSSNSALGLAALQDNTTGSSNTGLGQSALQDNHNGGSNTAVGYQALVNNNSGSTGGNYNSALGTYALMMNTSGSQNIGLGWGAGAINTTGSNDTYVGYNAGNTDADNFSTGVALQNATALGNNAEVQASSSLVLGAAGSNQVNVGIGTTIPVNTFSVSPLDYNTGNASVTTAGTTVTGSGTYWRQSMVGEQFIFSNGQSGFITAVASYTSLTLSTSQPVTAASNYRIQEIGLEVASAGTVGIGTYTPNAKLQVAANANDSTLIQVTNSTGGTITQINANGDVNLGGAVTASTVGLVAMGSTNAGGYGGIISAQKVTTGSAGGTVASMSTNLVGVSSGSSIQFGIYADSSGYPGSLIATSAIGSPVVGNDTLPISATLAANTTYWFVYWTNGTNNNNTYNNGSPANNWYYVSYGWPCSSSCTNGMPNSFPTGGTGLGITFNVWASYEPASAEHLTGSNGSATFENTTNSTTAFQVKASDGAVVLGVDTSNDYVNVNGSVLQTGLKTLYTNNTNNGQWVELGGCTLIAQFAGCSTVVNIVGGLSGAGIDNSQAQVGFRVYQQNAMGSNPAISVTVGANAENITPSNFVAVVSTETSGNTTVQLWGQINHTYESWDYTPTQLDYQGGNGTFFWTPQTAFSASQPTSAYLSVVGSMYNDVSGGSLSIQNAGGNNVLLSNTNTSNLVTTSDITGSTATNWTAKGTVTGGVVGDTTNPFETVSSIKAVAAAVTSGMQTSSFTSAIAASTQYQLTFWAKCSTSIATFTYGRQDVSGTDVNSTTTGNCGTTWTQYTTHYTTGATITSPNIYMDSGTTAAVTIWVDAISLVQTTTNAATDYSPGTIYLPGVVASPADFQNSANSTTAFQVQDSGGTSALSIDTINDRVTINSNNIPLYLNVNATGDEDGIIYQIAGANAGEVGIAGSTGHIINQTGANDLALKSINGNILFAAGGSSVDLTVQSSGNVALNNGALVLYNTGTAPTEVDGGMYYNSSSNSFRCGQNGAWVSCDGLVDATTAVSPTNITGTSLTSFGQPYAIPANDCQPGVVYLVTASGYFQIANTNSSVTLALEENGVQLSAQQSAVFNNATYTIAYGTATKYEWLYNATITCWATNEVMISSVSHFGNPAPQFTNDAYGVGNTTYIAWTNNAPLALYGSWNTNAGTGLYMNEFVVQRLGP
jgi:hypothetical protein